MAATPVGTWESTLTSIPTRGVPSVEEVLGLVSVHAAMKAAPKTPNRPIATGCNVRMRSPCLLGIYACESGLLKCECIEAAGSGPTDQSRTGWLAKGIQAIRACPSPFLNEGPGFLVVLVVLPP